MTTAVMSRSRAPSVGRPTLPSLTIDNSTGTGSTPALAPGPQTPGANKLQPGNAISLYQKCILIRERWRRVPGFQESFLDPDAPYAPEPQQTAATDPVSIVFNCLRLSPALCFLFNALDNPRKLDISPDARPLTTSACKRYTAHFLMAVKKELGWGDDQLFTVTQLHDTNTTGMVKVADCILELLSTLESQGQLLEPVELPESDQQQVKALDDRGKVVKEILESERAYVASLEILMDYKRQLVQNDILSQDTIHNIFLNLDALVDFQRRFQIGVEAHASQPPESQRFGHLFVSMEDAFSCYAPYCANFQGASELVEELKPDLMTLSHVLDPNYELPSQLIKPIQRICKLPLLMQQLVKTTAPTHPHYNELEQGLESIKRVTDRINETKRKQENIAAVQELKERVEDWKDHQLENFGDLLLEDNFFVLKGDTEREYHVYLFERIILCCKEVSLVGKKGTKSNSILGGRKSVAKGKKPQLQLKGRIYVNNVVDVRHNPRISTSQHMLQVSWKGDNAEEHFSIKCKTADNFQLWQKAILKAMEERKRASKANPARRMQHLHSPHSHFPNTPISEMGTPALYSATSDSSMQPGNRSSRGSNYQPSSRNIFDEEVGEYMDQIDSLQHGRRVQATQSLPPGARERDSAYANSRPRAHTQDSTSDAINQWRNKTPTAPPPPSVPRGTSMSSTASDSSYNGNSLSHKPSSEWGFSRSSSQEEDYRSNIARNASQASLPSLPANATNGYSKPSLRSRSASSPHVYQMPMGRSGSQMSADYQPGHNSAATMHTLHSSNEASSAADDHRYSQSSMGSHRSSGESSQAYTSATSPTSSAPQLPYLGNRMTGDAVAVRIKIRVAKDAYVIAVLSSINYRDLHEKVAKKIRLCGDANIDAANLRLKYEDEDGDRILITSDEDITLAFEGAKISQHSGTAALTIFVD